MEQYIKEVKNLEFRKEKLLEQVKKIETLLSGKYTHYYKFIEDEKGNYSEEKVWKMIEELIEALHKYDIYFLSVEEEWDVDDVKEFALTEQNEKFFRSFLYCVLRLGYSGIGVVDTGIGKGNFEDFVEMADAISRNTNYKEEDLLYGEKYEVTCEPFFSFNNLYTRVMNEPAHASVKEEKLVAMKRKYAVQIEETENHWAEYEKELIAAYGGKMTLEEIRVYEDEQIRAFEEENEVSRMEQELYEEEQKEIERFSNKEMFAEQYFLFRELYFQMDGYLLSRMRYIIEGMLDIYLYQNNLSKFLDDELFFKTFAMLRKTTSHVQKYLPEEVK